MTLQRSITKDPSKDPATQEHTTECLDGDPITEGSKEDPATKDSKEDPISKNPKEDSIIEDPKGDPSISRLVMYQLTVLLSLNFCFFVINYIYVVSETFLLTYFEKASKVKISLRCIILLILLI